MATLPAQTWDKIPVKDFTEAVIGGTGVYDVLMKANAAYMEQEYNKSRLRGPEYASVYLGMIDNTMRTALEFLVQSNKLALEAQTMQVQLEIAQIQKEQAEVALEIARQQLLKIPAEIALLEAQAKQVDQNVLNLQAEALNIPKMGNKIDADTDLIKQQKTNAVSQNLHVVEQTKMVVQQTSNAVIEGTVLTAQKCKLDAEYDVLVGTKLKIVAETSLLNQKSATEKAQTVGAGIDADSVLGKQIGLYTAQTEGFKRDAEQKAAKIMIDTWNVRRTTDESTEANVSNNLNDPAIGRAVTKMLDGVNA